MKSPTVAQLKVKIFADGADLKSMKESAANPLVKGFTPNPTLMRAAGVTDYKAFAAVVPSDASKKIQLGQQFLQNYPGTRYEEAVENQLVDAYYTTQDWNSFYSVSARVIEKDPDDVDALTVVGWVIESMLS